MTTSGWAMKWYREAARQFHASAHFSTGMLYKFGPGLRCSDDEEGLKWIRKSAEQGYEYARYLLASLYANGWRVIPKDEAVAIQ
jgi:TPR repeat protein